MKKIFLLFVMCIAQTACLGSNINSNVEIVQHINSNVGFEVAIEFVLIPSGAFSRDGTKFNISKPFYLGKYEVTQEQWVAVMEDNPSKFKGRTNPVENVSWDDVQEFIKRLNAKEGYHRYRLPTEMEWEYAARGGTQRRWFFDVPSSINELFVFYTKMRELQQTQMRQEDRDQQLSKLQKQIALLREKLGGILNAYAWFQANSSKTTHPVGQKKPNQYGLYDIYGNVWEWAQDWYESLPTDKEITDYRGPEQGSSRVLRGGSWINYAENCRSDSRIYYSPDYRRNNIGFRLALSPE